MSWRKETVNGMAVYSETKTLPASATTLYSSEMSFLKQGKNNNKYISILCVASAVTGTNIDVELLGTYQAGLTLSTENTWLLLDAPVADLTNATRVQGGRVDINAYPAPIYALRYTTDTNESANTITTYIMFHD